jgi:hypothetical protein
MDWCRGGGVRVADVDLLDARTTINYLYRDHTIRERIVNERTRGILTRTKSN